MKPEENGQTVAIVGGGFSGTMTAVQLARQPAGARPRIRLIERAAHVGRGIAYQTDCFQHVLNVPAGNMSALPDEPGHFVNWARQRDRGVTGSAFLPRSWYGNYLHDTLTEHARGIDFQSVSGVAIDLIREQGKSRLQLADGRCIEADCVVLATGNYPPPDPTNSEFGLARSPRYVRDPWAAGCIDRVANDDDVLLIGSGLTAIDAALALNQRGHRGHIHLVSRRGLLPQGHRPAGSQRPLSTPPELLQAKRTVRGLLQGFREAMRRGETLGHDWRDVLAAVRPITPTLWSWLSSNERARFLRHLRPFWDSHRHRLAPEIATIVEELRRTGRLVLHTARIVAAEPHPGGVRVQLLERGTKRNRIVDAAWIINCTGPASDIRRLGDPLWDSLLRRGLAIPDEFGLGVLTSPHGALLDGASAPSDWLYLIGPLRKAQLWECTAVPELRVHAAELATHLLAKHHTARFSPTFPAGPRTSLRAFSTPDDIVEAIHD